MNIKVLKRVATSILLLTFLAATPFWLPNDFGGQTGYVVVSGHSMDPTYATGDLLITRSEEINLGDVIVYKVKEGELGSGMLVVHRVVGGDPSGWITQGDNNSSTDPWRPTGDEIIGAVKVHLPKAGFVLNFARSPLFIALLGSVFVGSLVWPDKKERAQERERKALKKMGLGDPEDPSFVKENRWDRTLGEALKDLPGEKEKELVP